MNARLSRRRFLQAAAGVALAAHVSPADAAQQQPPRADRVRLGIVGVAGQGDYNLRHVAHEEIVALCDVDQNRAGPARKQYPKARFFDDFHRLIDQKELDAVVISTPDHTHAVIAAAALRAGKHVYCEKPLAHSVHEVRTIMELARGRKLATQLGTQIHAGDNYRRVVELVRAGAVGPVRRVHVWCSTRPSARRRAAKQMDVPKGLNYDLWLGPAPHRPYDTAHVPYHWRWYWEFGGGVLADMGCHFIDLAHWALDLRTPTTVAATGRVTYKGDNDVPDLMQVEYEYPARGNLPPVHLTWYHGVSGPDLEGKRLYDGFTSAVLFEGEKGELVSNYTNHRLLPEERYRDYRRPKQTIPASAGHHREWLQAIRTGGATTCNFDYGGALTEAVLMGNVAYRAGAKIQWDAKQGRTNVRAADQFLRREYRKGWTL
jgi:predicted dehydrogenase